MKHKLISLLFAFAGLAMASSASAQDKATLDLLVSKGLLTKDEAAQAAKSSVSFAAKDKNVKKITLTGRIQAQYAGIDITDEVSTNEFFLRRIYLGAAADLGAGWKGSIVVNFADGADLDSAIISKKVDSLDGTLEIGYKKVNFGYEETTSSSKLMTVERSAATRFFAENASSKGNLGFASKHTGIFWKGKIDAVEGLGYSASLNNSTKGTDGGYNDFSYWASVFYGTDVNEDVSVKGGLNFGFTSDMGDGDKTKANASMYSLNPYIAANLYGFDIWGEFMLGECSDRNSTEDASPMGANIGVEYKFDIGEWGKIAPAFRYSYLETDGLGLNTSGGMKAAPSTALFDEVQSIYIGVNWYIIGNSVKLQMGYEFANYKNGTDGDSDVDANAFRTQLQLMF